MQSFPQIVREALALNFATFARVIEDATQLLCNEKGQIGNMDITERLVKLKPEGEALVVGDLHGDLESLVDILLRSDFLTQMNEKSDAFLIFLGDYGDRGEFSAEVYHAVLKLKLLYPLQVILLRGNHEGPEDLMASPHDLPSELQRKFGEKWIETYSKIRGMFDCLYNAVLVEERCLMLHGGLPPQTKSIDDLANANATHPSQSFLEDMLWSDPAESVQEVCGSPRGAGKLFGERVTTDVLKRLNVKVLIRGHEPCREGFKISHNGKVLTLFSRKGDPYFNASGSYLQIPLKETFNTAEQLVPFIHRF